MHDDRLEVTDMPFTCPFLNTNMRVMGPMLDISFPCVE